MCVNDSWGWALKGDGVESEAEVSPGRGEPMKKMGGKKVKLEGPRDLCIINVEALPMDQNAPISFPEPSSVRATKQKHLIRSEFQEHPEAAKRI